MIACYCRVSSRDQKHDSQKAEITRWLRNHRISLRQVQWFVDKESGTTLKRSAFNRLQKVIFEGTVKTVREAHSLAASPSTTTRREACRVAAQEQCSHQH